MPFGDRARVLKMDVRVVERGRRMTAARENGRDRALCEQPDRNRDWREQNEALPERHATLGFTGRIVSMLHVLPGPTSRPYEDAPRLPQSSDRVDIRSLVRGDWTEIEIGPGRGWFLVERAQAEPRAALVGLEVRRKWAAIVDARLAERGLGGRARVFAEDARDALRRLAPDASVRRVFIHFPDPWWKKRHQKRLVVRDALLEQVARLLEPDGELFVQTDVEDRAAQYESLVSRDSRFAPAGDTAGSARLADSPYVARSPRERRAIADGLPVYRLRWRRRVTARS